MSPLSSLQQNDLAPKEDRVLQVRVTPGQIEYDDAQGNRRKFVFQCNPASLTRSRTISKTETKAGNTADGTTNKPGLAGRKYTHKPTPWRFDSLELWFDASMPSAPLVASETLSYADNLKAIEEALRHLEAISEPIQPKNENDSPHGAPPAPSPPLITLRLGKRTWEGHVSSVSILEKEFTHDLVPRQVKVTLGLEMTVSRDAADQNKLGGKK